MRKIKLLAIALIMAITVVGCSAEDEKVTKKEDKTANTTNTISSEYVNLTMVKPKTLNPIVNNDKSVGYIMNLIYDGLFTIDQNYNVVPQLVEEYGIAQNGMSVDIKLKDAKWHDGTSVTSNDVKFTIDLIQRNPESPYNFLTQNISSVSIQSDKQFTINFKAIYPFSIDTLIFPIVSEQNLKSMDSQNINNLKNNLVGNGPYKIEDYEDRKGMVLSVNNEYYGKIETNAKGIKVEIVPDEEAQVSMVIALRSDIANVSLHDLSKFYQNEFKITTYEGREYESIIFNYDNPFLKDTNFRKAIAASIDKNKILDEGYMGDATLVNFPLNSKSKYYNNDVKSIKYNKDNAKKYLEKVKPITDQENTRIENKSDLKSQENKNESSSNKEQEQQKSVKEMIANLNLKIIVNKENSERLKSAYLIGLELESIGIDTTVNELSSDEMDKAIESKDYDLALIGWELSSIPDAISIIQNCGYSDEKLNNYITSLLSTSNPNQIEDIYNSIQKYINDNVLFMSLLIRDDYIVTNKRLEGTIKPNDFDVYEGISNLKIKLNK
ncbi:MAG: ABC transporter substrate-binding protein [Peptostreptococcaceae bacterium]